MRLQTKHQPKHHRTLRGQLVADKLATLLFTAMGLGVIVAVLGMMFFFTSTILPLFAPVELELERLTVLEGHESSSASAPWTPLAFVHDLDSPFMAEVHSANGSCAVAQGVSLPERKASKGARHGSEPSGTWRILGWRHLLWPAAAGAPTWSDIGRTNPLAAEDTSGDVSLQCFPLTRSRFVVVRTPRQQGSQTVSEPVVSGLRLAVVEISTQRDFLGTDAAAALTPQALETLESRGWLIADDARFLTQASAQAPVAALTTDLKAIFAIGALLPESKQEGLALRNQLSSALESLFRGEWPPGFGGVAGNSRALRFVHDGLAPQGAPERHVLTLEWLPGEGDGADRGASTEFLAILVDSSENFLTGLKEVDHRGVRLPASMRFIGMIAGGEYALFQSSDGQVWKRSWSSLWGGASGSKGSQTDRSDKAAQSGPRPAETLPLIEFPDAPLALDFGRDSSSSPDAAVVSDRFAGPAVLSFGGNTLVTIDASGVCAGFDVSLFLLDPGSGLMKSRWRRQCGPPASSRAGGDARLFWQASPAQRIGLLMQAQSFSGVDLTTGDTLFTGDVPKVLQQDGSVEVAFGQSGRFVQMRSEGAVAYFRIHAEHLEGSIGRLFRKIHYEGYREPSYSWQSASATDDFEAKFSLWPLIWGTLKATLYSMLFAAPLGIFAAVYSSEILDRTTRNFIKPTIEMMASLPSVVLGYLAAIVLAPWIESNILGVLLCGMVLPCTLYFFGNMVSKYSAEHVSGRGLYASRRLLFIILVGFALAMAALLRLGRFIESLAFGGDLKIFLAGGEGSAAALYGILLLPLVLVSLWTIPAGRFVKSWRTLVFLAGPLLSFAIGYAMHRSVGESTLSVAGYSQRNALVICVAMGFAIIPIIYSLAEDALTSVPGSLRAGSLACGASVWQTTARVVLPTAASGIFSALMVGFGRAIGETMIVVMATGNSPLMSINPFEGLRSLAANIAVELPEAPQGGSHYRILFFSGFLLFVLTFSMNTLAEFMRTRYRKRNKAL